MKCLIIYYSMAGNTRKIAHAVQKGVARVAEKCDIVAIRGANGVPGMRPGHIFEYDLIGIGSPVWRGTMTPNILNFINSMPSRPIQFTYNNCYERKFEQLEKQQCFFFLTHGKWPGSAVRDVWTTLENRGLNVIGWDDWYGDAFMSYSQMPWQTYGHPDDISLKEAEEFGTKMALRSLKVSGGDKSVIPILPGGQEYLNLYGRSYTPNNYVDWIKHHYGLVTIDRQKCTNCGLCEDNCPMGAIDLKADNPVLPNCMWCTTCDMVCPTGAIDVHMHLLRKDRGSTKQEMREKAKILQKLFVEGQAKLASGKQMRWHVEEKDLFKDGYVFDIPKRPHVVILKEGWEQKNK